MIEGMYFDGASSRAHRVRLSMANGVLRLTGEVEREVPASQLRLAERLGSAARRIELGDGAYCEIAHPDASDALESLLADAGLRASYVDRAQRSWVMALAAVLLVALMVFAGYRWGVPAAAKGIAHWLSPAVAEQLSEQTLKQFDAQLLRPSALPLERQAQLSERFRALQTQRPGVDARLLFRSSRMPPNAFALPDGTIVLLDPLVALADNDDQMMAVVAHELGHVEARHGMRLLVQGSLVAGFLALWVGDVSALLAAAPAALLHARYSRGFEEEADRHAVQLLKANGLPSALLADMLEKLAEPLPDEDSFLASHPAPASRIARLRNP